jgi:hypothetical protein
MMPRLVLNYMRPLAMLLFVLVSMAIIAAYFFIPKIFVASLPFFYHQFWHRLTLLFIIAILFLAFSFYMESNTHIKRWMVHLVAVLLLIWFVGELCMLFKTSDIFLAFIN